MATSNLNFASTVDAWVAKVKGAELEVFKRASQDVLETMQLGAPVITNFLRAGVQTTLNEPAPIDMSKYPVRGQTYAIAESANQMALTIANAKLGDTIYGCFTAAYAGFVEYGTSKMAPRGFVRSAAARWAQIVDRVAGEVANEALKNTVDAASANRSSTGR